jgi:hypothetical protein
MSVATDGDGKRRGDGPLLTAGPYEADPKFLPASRPVAGSPVGTIGFDFVKPLPKELGALSNAMARELPIGKLPDGKTGFLLKDVPVMNENPPVAATLDKEMRSMRMSVVRSAKSMHFALGLVNAGKGGQARCRISRQDGTVVELRWEAGRNIGPSLGKWDGKLGGDGKDARTQVGWQSKDGQARIFLTTWNNDNEWYPVKEIEWILDDDSASLLIFGVTSTR